MMEWEDKTFKLEKRMSDFWVIRDENDEHVCADKSKQSAICKFNRVNVYGIEAK